MKTIVFLLCFVGVYTILEFNNTLVVLVIMYHDFSNCHYCWLSCLRITFKEFDS